MNRQPNILWIMTDEQRTDSLGCYGSSWTKTPFLDHIAESGCKFSNAYTPSPVCAAARASILTGQSPSAIKLQNNDDILQDQYACFLTKAFEQAGYQTASFGKHHYNNNKHAFGTQEGITIGNKVGYCEYHVPKPEDANEVQYQGGVIDWLFAGRLPGTINDMPEMYNVNKALNFYDNRYDPTRPFFLRLSLNAPHTPVVIPKPYDTLYNADDIDVLLDYPSPPPGLAGYVYEYFSNLAGNHNMTRAQIARARQCYYGAVTMLDDIVQYFVNALRERGALENTIIVFMSDHGTHLGDHGFFQKQSFFDASCRVPFFITGLNLPRGKTIDTPINTASLLPTLLDLIGIHCPQKVHYESLVELMRTDGDSKHKPVFSEIDFGTWGYRDGDRCVMIRKGNWKLSLFLDPSENINDPFLHDMMLFDLSKDPGERCNLMNNVWSGRGKGIQRLCGSGTNDFKFDNVVQDLLKDLQEWDRNCFIETPPCSPAFENNHRAHEG